MFSCTSVAKGVYNFKMLDDNFIQLKDLGRLEDVKGFLTESGKRAAACKDHQASLPKETSITDRLKYLMDLLREDSLTIMGECTSQYCPCSRFIGAVNRELIELSLYEPVDNAENIISIGPGGMHQDLRIIAKRTPENGAPAVVNYYVLDGFKDFFEMTTNPIDPYVYTGPMDEHAGARAEWFSYKCMLYGTFLTALKGKVNLYLCESADDCVNFLKSSDSRRNVVLGIDILDDFGVFTLPAFMTVALRVPCTAVTVSNNYWDIFINEHFKDDIGSDFSSRGHIKEISKGDTPYFNLYALYIIYKLNRDTRRNIRRGGLILASLCAGIAYLYFR